MKDTSIILPDWFLQLHNTVIIILQECGNLVKLSEQLSPAYTEEVIVIFIDLFHNEMH